MRRVWNDKNGNKLIADNKQIKLKIKGHNRLRKLFDVVKENDYIYTKRNRGKHLLYASNSYGFNWDVLTSAKVVKNVLLEDDKGSYLIPIKKIISDGHFLHFKKKQFELQIFLGLDEIEKHRVNPKEFKNVY